MTLEEIKSKLDSLSPVKVSFVTKVIEALANPPALNVRSAGTWLTEKPDWTEYFGLALSVHHGATTEPLWLTAFETVFRNACEHMGWNVPPPESQTQRFIDMTVSPCPGMTLHLSLKSTAAKNLSKTSLHISKLTEAPGFRTFARHLKDVSRRSSCFGYTVRPSRTSSCSAPSETSRKRPHICISLLKSQSASLTPSKMLR
ncbi:hypothetical protein FLM9_243 [Candidatus Synechococcus spongiarum]|uniref:Uncharacterized protein n=1 Tax=Candidatus Synechococcus spongiarum TaxID=431041 RepID=A0A164Z389_9SYNE|nr:hypothetical protein FLM9_243 [Candidatus Synechococcus spongiarum]